LSIYGILNKLSIHHFYRWKKTVEISFSTRKLEANETALLLKGIDPNMEII